MQAVAAPLIPRLTLGTADPLLERVRWRSTLPYALFHVAALTALVLVPPQRGDLILCAVAYAVRMFFLVSAYHRYFSHRSFSTSRGFQLVLALLGASSGEQGPIWWAWVHRHHHRYTDRPEDFHSPKQRAFLWAHVGWIFGPRAMAADYDAVKDLSRYPELRWLDRYWPVPFACLGLAFFAAAGVHGLVWGFFASTLVLWQASFCINSLAHLIGRRRFPTPDTSRNSLGLALLTLGEGWHNNHHYHPGSMWQGFYWWQIDLAGYGLQVLAWLGLIWDVHRPPAQVLALGRGWRTNANLAPPMREPSAHALIVPEP